MKKSLMLFVASMMMVAPQSFAQTDSPDLSEIAYDLEPGALTEEQLQQPAPLQMTTMASRNDVVAGAIVGLIAGVIAAELLDSKLDRHSRRDDRYHPRYPQRPPQRQVVCYAENPYRQVFRSFAWRAQAAQRQAVQKCQQASYSYCRPLGCQVLGW